MTKSFYTLSEAYHQVYQPQDVNEDFNDWVNFLIQEGYDLNEYSNEELLDAYYGGLDEAKAHEGLTALQKIRKRNKEGNLVMPAGDQTKERRMYHQGGRGVKKEKGAKSVFGTMRHVGGPYKEEFDLYDIISDYLVSEGFCESYEDADVIMANMSEEWRESILDEAVKGSQRSIGNRITGNDIRTVTRGNKKVYEKPKWKDGVENEVHGGSQLRQRRETEHTNDTRDRERIEANKKRIRRLNAAKNIEQKQVDSDYENSIDFSRPGMGKSGYMEVPTDYRVRKRRSSGR